MSITDIGNLSSQAILNIAFLLILSWLGKKYLPNLVSIIADGFKGARDEFITELRCERKERMDNHEATTSAIAEVSSHLIKMNKMIERWMNLFITFWVSQNGRFDQISKFMDEEDGKEGENKK